MSTVELEPAAEESAAHHALPDPGEAVPSPRIPPTFRSRGTRQGAVGGDRVDRSDRDAVQHRVRHHNFALGRAELDAGYILTCQSHPTTPFVEVDYDA